jgi:hypothetical protein
VINIFGGRLLVLKIFHTLVDRKGNLDKLSQPTVEPATDLIAQKANANKQVIYWLYNVC